MTKYKYNGQFSVEDGKSGKVQQWIDGKVYDSSEINVSDARIKTLVNLGYLKEVVQETQKSEPQTDPKQPTKQTK